MRKSLLCAAFLGVGLLAGGAGITAGAAATTQPGEHAFGRGPLARLFQARMGRAMTLRAELNLTDEQRDAIKQTLKAHKEELATAVQPVVAAKRALRNAVLAEKPDDAAIHKAADDLGKKIGDAAVVIAKVKTELATNARLTPDQMQKITDFRAANDASVDQLFQQIEKGR